MLRATPDILASRSEDVVVASPEANKRESSLASRKTVVDLRRVLVSLETMINPLGTLLA